MIKVEMLPDMTPTQSASHAALQCYQSTVPKVGKEIDVENRLFRVSHHTTMQHSDAYRTNSIDGIAVGDVTFGLHLVSPFYNTDQRSGRYAAKMFTEPDFDKMMQYVRVYWPQVSSRDLVEIERYLEFGVKIYQENKSEANKIAADFLRQERPFIANKMVAQIAPKVAQEQLRMFISTIFPTALDFTLNLTALVAMYEEAWTPAMKDVTAKIAGAFSQKYPDIAYVFDESRRREGDWFVQPPSHSDIEIATEPYIFSCNVQNEHVFVQPNADVMHPVDKSHFAPEMMNNSIGDIEVCVGMSVATMGQDQRHRTIRRGAPQFTGAFYLPPIVQKLGLGGRARDLMSQWISIEKTVPGTLAMILAPYGAVVEYIKKGSFNAILHEQYKRLCWCAQEEIYYLGVLEREAVAKKCGINSDLLAMFQPPCFELGKCAEGDRYCGRDIRLRNDGDYFPRRMV
ncbi:MAG: hypothetical protein ACKUBY_04340 [Candidatus Moraniibacteriota bacterium]|jgi:hypothetical protein